MFALTVDALITALMLGTATAQAVPSDGAASGSTTSSSSDSATSAETAPASKPEPEPAALVPPQPDLATVPATPPLPAAELRASEKSWQQQIASRLRPRVMLYYDRGLVTDRSADFGHGMGVSLSLGVNIQPTLIATAALGIDRRLGEPIERFMATNTRLSLTKLFKLDKIGFASVTGFGQLPTNPDDFEFLTYRGSFGLSSGLFNDQVFTFRGGMHALGGGVSLTGARHIFQYTTPIGGGSVAAAPNTTWVLGMGVNLIYTLMQRYSFIMSFRDNLNWNAMGRAEDRYELAASIQVIGPYGIRGGITVATADRTTDYDRVTSNIRLYKSDATSITFSLGFAPVFETATQ